MLNQAERQILELMKGKLLATKGELLSAMGRSDGIDIVIQRLRDMGYVDKVEPLGICYVITQAGMRALRGE